MLTAKKGLTFFDIIGMLYASVTHSRHTCVSSSMDRRLYMIMEATGNVCVLGWRGEGRLLDK